MNIINIFGLYPFSQLPTFLSNTKTGLDFAANNLQEAIVKGYQSNHVNYHIINAPFLGSWPLYYKKLHVSNYKNNLEHLESIGYINLPIAKRSFIRSKVKARLFKYLKNHSTDDTVLLFYNFSCVSIAKDIKQKFPYIKICLLVTDLPEYMSSNDNSWVSRLNKILRRKKRDYEQYVDCYIILAEKMREKIQIGNKPFLVMEGIYNPTLTNNIVEKSSNKTILYTGNLDPRYGIEDLINAFSMIKGDDYELWIRGNGACEEIVHQRAKTDSRIKYFEKMSHKDLFNLQRMATVLVNPVHSSQEFTNFFFPSKTLEYLASGTPTLMCKLNCMPPEYENHLFFFEDETIQGMASKLQEICTKSTLELNAFGNAAKNFILTNKTPEPQINKLVNFLQSQFKIKQEYY